MFDACFAKHLITLAAVFAASERSEKMRETWQTPKSVKKEGEEVGPGSGAEIPLQPVEKTMVKQAVPLQPMEEG